MKTFFHFSDTLFGPLSNIVSVRQMGGRAEIYTLTGQLVATTPVAFGDNPIRFDLTSGVYVLRVVYDNGDISSHKLVINK